MLLEKQGQKKAAICPFCSSPKIIKRGKRKKKYEEIQVYYCKHCEKRFVQPVTKNKSYPLKIILDSLTLYNRFFSLKEIAESMEQTYGIKVTEQTVSNWLRQFRKYTPFARMRSSVLKQYRPKDMIEEARMFHNQVYDFKFHRAKTELIMEEHKNRSFGALKGFLELIIAECPHQIFRQTEKRSSEYKNMFNFDRVKIASKSNTAKNIAALLTQAISNNKERHEILEEFMLINDSVTVAIEVPVLLGCDDIRHLKHELNFEIPFVLEDGEYITGHIDVLQIRNGYIHIMDFKPSASKEKPLDQLVLYALALSRLTGIRLYHMKCAWFDGKNYYEFFPLHVVYKKKKQKRLPQDQQRLKKLGK